MCGIAGIINLNNQKPIAKPLHNMVKSLAKRGPDDEGYALFNNDYKISCFGEDSINKECKNISETYNNAYEVGFGFRQLKIIDLSQQSHQPMCDTLKNYWIIFNGEIYNYKELRSQLTSLGYNFISSSDTEVLLYSFIQWKEKALEKLNGMFAFAIYDCVNKTVFIARDRIGIKPLYFYNTGTSLIFGSTIQSIIDSGLYHSEISWEGLWQNFRFSTAQRPNTVFKNIYALEPANYITVAVNNGRLFKNKYWTIPVNSQNNNLTEQQALELVEEHLIKSINYRLVADVEVGSFMSGGIDSSLVSVIASKVKPDIKALTLGFKEYKHLNEVPQATQTAKENKLNHIISEVTVNKAIKNIKETTITYEEPYHSISANIMLAQMASENNLKVMLSGLGGDELFGGYDCYKKLFLWKKLSTYKPCIKLIPTFHHKIKKAKQLVHYKNIGEFYSHYYTNFSDNELKNLFLDRQFNTDDLLESNYQQEIRFTDDFEALSFFDLKSYIGNHQMRATDKSAMRYSIESRFPLLDHQFIEAVFSVPTKFKLKNNIQKYILKEVAKKYIPMSSINMTKKGLSLPLKQWVSKDLKDFVHETIQLLKKRHLFNNKYIDKIHQSKNEYKIWQLVSTELWLQNFIDAK